MQRPRVSIAGLMGLVVLVSIAFAALRNPTTLWASIIFTLTVGLLSAAIVGAILGRGSPRATWIGFAVFGWVYMAFSFGPVPNSNGVKAPPFATALVYSFLKTYEMEKANRRWVAVESRDPQDEAVSLSPPPPVAFPRVLRPVDLMDLRRIVHSLGAIVFGLVGSATAQAFGRRGRAEAES